MLHDFQQILFITNENNTLMKLVISSEMKSDENSYLLLDAMNSLEEVDFATADSQTALHVVLLNFLSQNQLWALLSNGIVYEYNLCSNNFSIIENSGQICSFAVS